MMRRGVRAAVRRRRLHRLAGGEMKVSDAGNRAQRRHPRGTGEGPAPRRGAAW